MPHRYLKVSPDFFTPETPLLFFKIVCYMGMFFLPLLVALLPSGLKPGGFLREKGRMAVWLGLLALLSAMAVGQYTLPEGGEDRLMPYRPGFISIYGPVQCRAPPRRPGSPPGHSFASAAHRRLGAGRLPAAAGRRCTAGPLQRRHRPPATSGPAHQLDHRHPRRLRAADVPAAQGRRPGTGPEDVRHRRLEGQPDPGGEFPPDPDLSALLFRSPAPDPDHQAHAGLRTAVPVYLFTLGLLVYYLATGKFFIRYALLLVPGVVILPFDAFRRARLNRTLLIIGLVASFALGVVWTRDQISFNEARWAAGHWLLDQQRPGGPHRGRFRVELLAPGVRR